MNTRTRRSLRATKSSRFVVSPSSIAGRVHVIDTVTDRRVYHCTRSEARLWIASASLFTPHNERIL